jgi:hypothetical protein
MNRKDTLDNWGTPVDPESAPSSLSDTGSGSNSTPPTDSGSSGSGGSLSDYLTTGSSLLNTGLNAYNRIAGKPATPAAAKTPAASQSQLSKYLPWALIGGGVLILLAIVLPSLRSK